jgi:hypothetical protein
VAKVDIASQVVRPWAHAAPAAGPSGHDASEGPLNPAHRLPEDRPSQARHVACVDCHNPHAATGRTTLAPRAPGALAGVWGIDRTGNRVEAVSYEYEVCFKCHAASANQPQARLGGTSTSAPRRQASDATNLLRVLDPVGAVSSHPVVGTRRNPALPGLLPAWSGVGSIYCGDCHASDTAASGRGPRGPHGSSYEHILERPYVTRDGTVEGDLSYGLCYKCHDARLIRLTPQQVQATPGLAPSGFPAHNSHVKRGTPCSACHNAHGSTRNAHLIDFDLNVVGPAGGLYQASGRNHGSCTLTCHDSKHDAATKSY